MGCSHKHSASWGKSKGRLEDDWGLSATTPPTEDSIVNVRVLDRTAALYDPSLVFQSELSACTTCHGTLLHAAEVCFACRIVPGWPRRDCQLLSPLKDDRMEEDEATKRTSKERLVQNDTPLVVDDITGCSSL
uniref:Uncharacterized protein n=1 Tax=Knipowitschia caucasica TaxID=637954 RepID=A0AAV2LZQ2_KNICA